METTTSYLRREAQFDDHEDASATFDALYRRWHAPLCRLARASLRSAPDAEDVVDAVFTDIWRRRQRKHPEQITGAYLRACVRNRVRNRAKKARIRRRWLERQTHQRPPCFPDPIDAMVLRELQLEYANRLATLPVRCRQAFVLVVEEGLSYAETGDRLGTSPKTVKNQVAQARRKLRGDFQRWRGMQPRR